MTRIDVPVTVGFNRAETIGTLSIDREALPAAPDFVFALGFLAKEYAGPPREVPSEPYAGAYELNEVSVVTDLSYLGYLRQIGVVAASAGEAEEAGDPLRPLMLAALKMQHDAIDHLFALCVEHVPGFTPTQSQAWTAAVAGRAAIARAEGRPA